MIASTGSRDTSDFEITPVIAKGEQRTNLNIASPRMSSTGPRISTQYLAWWIAVAYLQFAIESEHALCYTQPGISHVNCGSTAYLST
jgi:hypothetical protein